ncbi:hypothetical protein HK101_001012 [Irineochytrium annulatum]|nr:hypothetical protein HK101_001012 [Irineochytrium annulatum]
MTFIDYGSEADYTDRSSISGDSILLRSTSVASSIPPNPATIARPIHFPSHDRDRSQRPDSSASDATSLSMASSEALSLSRSPFPRRDDLTPVYSPSPEPGTPPPQGIVVPDERYYGVPVSQSALGMQHSELRYSVSTASTSDAGTGSSLRGRSRSNSDVSSASDDDDDDDGAASVVTVLRGPSGAQQEEDAESRRLSGSSFATATTRSFTTGRVSRKDTMTSVGSGSGSFVSAREEMTEDDDEDEEGEALADDAVRRAVVGGW